MITTFIFWLARGSYRKFGIWMGVLKNIYDFFLPSETGSKNGLHKVSYKCESEFFFFSQNFSLKHLIRDSHIYDLYTIHVETQVANISFRGGGIGKVQEWLFFFLEPRKKNQRNLSDIKIYYVVKEYFLIVWRTHAK